MTICVHSQEHERRGCVCFKATCVVIRVQGGPQGPSRCDRCFGPSEWGKAIRSTYNGGVIGPCLSWFGPFDCSATGRSFVPVAGPNQPETEPRRPLGLETSCPVTENIKSTPYLGRAGHFSTIFVPFVPPVCETRPCWQNKTSSELST